MNRLTSDPLFWGIGIALLIGTAVLVTVTWFPGLEEILNRHKQLLQAVYFSASLFGVCGYRLWSWHRRSPLAYWACLSVLFATHVLAVSLYSAYVRPILGWQWVRLIALECFIVVFFGAWAARRFGN